MNFKKKTWSYPDWKSKSDELHSRFPKAGLGLLSSIIHNQKGQGSGQYLEQRSYGGEKKRRANIKILFRVFKKESKDYLKVLLLTSSRQMCHVKGVSTATMGSPLPGVPFTPKYVLVYWFWKVQPFPTQFIVHYKRWDAVSVNDLDASWANSPSDWCHC